MQITLSDGSIISGNDLAGYTLRSDCVPVPVSLEFTVICNDDKLKTLLIEGSEVQINNISLTIVKVQLIRKQYVLTDGKLFSAISCTAVLSSCEKLLKPVDKAIIMNSGNTLAGIYRACRVKTAFSADIPVPKFVCYFGVVPTTAIARAMQQEASIIYYDAGANKLAVSRIDAMFNKTEELTFDKSNIAWLDNKIVEDKYKPSYISIATDGTNQEGSTSQNKQSIFIGGLDTRQLKNMSKVLITRGVMDRPLDFNLMAGDIIKIEDKKYLFLTVAHRYISGILGGDKQMATRAWVASL